MIWRYFPILAFIFASTSQAVSENASSLTSSDFHQAFTSARSAESVARAMAQPIIPDSVKAMLLESRPEDREFARSLIVHWKSLNRFRVTPGLRTLLVQESNGISVLRIAKISETEFEINGMRWVLPETGSIVRSLQKTLRDKVVFSPARGSRLDAMIQFIPRAIAADVTSSPVATAPALLFILNQGGRSNFGYGRITPPVGMRTGDAKTALFYEDQGAVAVANGRSTWDWLFNSDAEITCTDSGATGKAQVGGELVDFEARKDGTLVLNLGKRRKTIYVESPKSIEGIPNAESFLRAIDKLRKDKGRNSEKARWLRGYIETSALRISRIHEGFNKAFDAAINLTEKTGEPSTEELNKAFALAESMFHQKDVVLWDAVLVGECQNSKCDPKPTKMGDGLRPWFRNDEAVKEALKWRPKSSKSATRILPGAAPDDDLIVQGKVAEEDFETVKKLIFEADGRWPDLAAPKEVPYARRALLGMRMFGPCCADKECREKELYSAPSVKFVDKTKSAPTKK